MENKFSLIGAFMIAAARMVAPVSGQSSFEKMQRTRSWRVGGYNVPHQGAQEIARRRRHIERGQLREQNGLLRTAVG